MEKCLFGSTTALGDCVDVDKEDEDGQIDVVDEVAERRGAMPKRGDGGWVVI